jgi:hypothetical protein
MMEVTSPGGSPSANGLAAGAGGGYQIDPLLILDHLAQVCEITLGASKKELENVGSLLSKARVSDTTQRVQRWAESQAVLYLQKDIASGDVLDGPLDGTSTYLKAGRERFGLTAILRPDKLQLQSCHRHFILSLDDSLDRPFETTVSYRSYDTHFFTNTDN